MEDKLTELFGNDIAQYFGQLRKVNNAQSQVIDDCEKLLLSIGKYMEVTVLESARVNFEDEPYVGEILKVIDKKLPDIKTIYNENKTVLDVVDEGINSNSLLAIKKDDDLFVKKKRSK